MITEELKKLYTVHTGHEPETIDELPSSGSNRRYFRLTGTPTLIGVSGESVEENRAFLYMAEHFRRKGLPVPEVFIRSEDEVYYLQEDLGDTLLFNAIEKGRKTSVFGEEEKQLLRKTIRLLPAIQFAGADGMDFSYCYPQAEFNSRSILWDLNYFKYCFLKATGMDFQEDRLEDDFQKMADVLLRSSSATFMYRDFQSRNVMIKDGEPWLIDFQGGRKGPVYYDVASFLWQAKANYPDGLRLGAAERGLSKRCVNTNRWTKVISMPSFVTSYCSAPCRYWAHTVFAVTSRRSPTSSKVCLSPLKTCANCCKNLTPNTPTSAKSCTN